MSGTWSRSISSPFPPLACASSSSSSCSLTIGAGSCTSTSPSIPPRRGRLSRSWTPFPTTPPRPISFATVTPIYGDAVPATSEGHGDPRGPHGASTARGRILSPSALSARSGATVSTHVLVLSERHLRHVLTRYFTYYHRARTHLSLDKDAPDGRPVEPPRAGQDRAAFRKSVACTTATSGERRSPPLGPPTSATRHRSPSLPPLLLHRVSRLRWPGTAVGASAARPALMPLTRWPRAAE